jgi:hypothetical protein
MFLKFLNRVCCKDPGFMQGMTDMKTVHDVPDAI